MKLAPKDSHKSTAAWAIGGLLLLLAISVTVVGEPFDSMRQHSQQRALAKEAFGSRGLTRVLARLGVLHSRPGTTAPSPTEPGSEPRAGWSNESFDLEEIGSDQLSAVLQIPQEWIDRGVPVVSLQLDPVELAQLRRHRLRRGRGSERPAHFAWVENGRVTFASRVGFRLHGGKSRRQRKPTLHGYRIYFRRSEGADHLPRDLLDTGRRAPARRVVLRRDGGPDIGQFRGDVDWYFTDAMSRDIARQIGLEAPYSTPAAVFVNGQFQQVRDVVERIDAEYLISRFGHAQFVLARTKRMTWEPTKRVKLGPEMAYREFDSWARNASVRTLAEVQAKVDVENLCRWWVLVMATGLRDHLQGTAIRDLSEANARWQWIPWDLDASLGVARHRPLMDDQLRPTFGPNDYAHRDPRTVLLKRLFRSDPAFRSMFSTVFDEIYNHRLTPEYTEGLTARYEETLRRFDLDTEFLTYVRAFLAERPVALRNQMRRTLRFGKAHPVTVNLPPGVQARIDSFDYETVYYGHYFDGSRLRLDIGETDPATFAGWQVGDRLHSTPELELVVDRPLHIFLILADKQTA